LSKGKLILSFLEKHKGNKESCNLCPRQCEANRRVSLGACKEPFYPRVSSFQLHHGEEFPLSGFYGSGTIFFSGCNLNCVYCQNFQISQLHEFYREETPETLAGIMLKLQEKGAHNINLVSPTHFVYAIVEALKIAYEKGLAIPVVYNTGGYDRPEIIRDLEGIIDIYLPDVKYYSESVSEKLSNVYNYFEKSSQSLLEMYRQMGDELIKDENGIAKRGLMIRHLVLPEYIDESKKILKWIVNNISENIYLNIMGQYHPCYLVNKNFCSEINRKLTKDEYGEVLNYARDLGFKNIESQIYLP